MPVVDGGRDDDMTKGSMNVSYPEIIQLKVNKEKKFKPKEAPKVQVKLRLSKNPNQCP